MPPPANLAHAVNNAALMRLAVLCGEGGWKRMMVLAPSAGWTPTATAQRQDRLSEECAVLRGY